MRGFKRFLYASNFQLADSSAGDEVHKDVENSDSKPSSLTVKPELNNDDSEFQAADPIQPFSTTRTNIVDKPKKLTEHERRQRLMICGGKEDEQCPVHAIHPETAKFYYLACVGGIDMVSIGTSFSVSCE